MAKLLLSINNDADQNGIGDAAVLTNATKIFGSLSTNAEYIGYRITGVTIPNAATIRHAYIKVYCEAISTSTFTYSLKGEAVDNSAAFEATVNNLSNRTLTTAAFALLLHDLANNYRVFDVTAIVQEIVNRAGWASGNAMTFIFTVPSLSAIATLSHIESANAPEFAVIYDGSADSVCFPTVSVTGTYTNPNNAFSSNDLYATTVNLPTASQIYESFGIADLTDNTIDGILVQVEAKVNSTTDRSEYTIELSWDGGTTWTTLKRAFQFPIADSTHCYGGADAWSHTFIPSELTNINFKVRISNDFTSATNDASVDCISVQIFYRTTVVNMPDKWHPLIEQPYPQKYEVVGY